MYSVMNIFFIFWIAPSQPGKRKTAGMKWKEWNWFLTLLHTHRGNFEQYKEVRQHDDELCICISGWLQLVRLLLYLLVAGKISRLGIIPTIESSSLCDAIVHILLIYAIAKKRKEKRTSSASSLLIKEATVAKMDPFPGPNYFYTSLTCNHFKTWF